MGLSNEERQEKFYWGIMFWRASLAKLSKTLLDQKNKESVKVVESWIRTVDAITGKMVVKMNGSGSFWILGPNENNVQSLFNQTYGVAHRDRSPFGNKAKYHSLRMLEDTSRSDFANILTGTNASEISTIAQYWDAFDYIDRILYPICRYEDDLFDCLYDDLVVLFGEITNLRYAIIKDTAVWWNEDVDDIRELEHAFLAKYRIFQYRIERESSKLTGSKAKNRYDRLMNESFDINPIVTDLKNMPLFQVQKELEEIDEEKYEKHRKFDSEYDKGRKGPKDFVIGPQPRASEDLEEIIHNADKYTEEEYSRAQNELKYVYSSYAGDSDYKKQVEFVKKERARNNTDKKAKSPRRKK